MTTFIFPAQTVDTTGLATQTEQEAQTALLTQIESNQGADSATLVSIDGKLDSQATAAKQDTGNSSLATIAGVDFATQTTLAAVLAKILAAPATEAKQDDAITQLTSIAGKDFATQTTLAAILAKLIAAPATEAKQDTGNTSLAAINTTLTNVSDTVNSAITAAHPVLDTRAILFAVNPGGTYGNIERTNGGNLKVAVEEFDSSLPSGTNVIGQVSIDQTTPGTTNLVALAANQSVNNTQIAGNAISTGVGPSGTGVQRVKEANVASATLANVASSATSVTLQASNASRSGLTIFNDSTAILYVKYGATASSTSYTVQIAAGGYYEMPQPIYSGIVDGIWASANGNARMTEW